MSHPAAFQLTDPFPPALSEPDDIRIALRVAEDIADNFATTGGDLHAARQAAMRAIGAYQPRNGAEVLHAARIVALSMTELDLLRTAAQPDIDPVMKLRFIREALRLERATAQAQRALSRQQETSKCAAEPLSSAKPEIIEAVSPRAENEAVKTGQVPAAVSRQNDTQLKAPPALRAQPSSIGQPERLAICVERVNAAEAALMSQTIMAGAAAPGAGPRITPRRKGGDRTVLLSSASWTVGNSAARFA